MLRICVEDVAPGFVESRLLLMQEWIKLSCWSNVFTV